MKLPEVNINPMEDDFMEDETFSLIEKLLFRNDSKKKSTTAKEDYIPQPKLSFKEKWNLWKEIRKNMQQEEIVDMPTKADLIIQKIAVVLPFIITCLSVLLTLCFSVAAISLLPKILSTAFMFGVFLGFKSYTKKEMKELKEMKKSYQKNHDINLEKQHKKEKKLNLFKKLKKSILETKENSKKIETNPIPKKSVFQNDNQIEFSENIFNPKFTLNRIASPVKIKSWNVGRIKGLGIYYVSVPKDNKNAQKFIREELKENMPDEKIQTFETESQKVFVLSKKPNIFK